MDIAKLPLVIPQLKGVAQTIEAQIPGLNQATATVLKDAVKRLYAIVEAISPPTPADTPSGGPGSAAGAGSGLKGR